MAMDVKTWGVRVLILLGVFAYSIAMFTSCMAAGNVRRAQMRFTLDEQHFADAVNFSVSNYLNCIVLPALQDKMSGVPEKPKTPHVEEVAGMSFWTKYTGEKRVLIRGVAYRVGDYCTFGEILRIGDDRVYCVDGDEICILRPARSEDGGARGFFKPAPPASPAPDEIRYSTNSE